MLARLDLGRFEAVRALRKLLDSFYQDGHELLVAPADTARFGAHESSEVDACGVERASTAGPISPWSHRRPDAVPRATLRRLTDSSPGRSFFTKARTRHIVFDVGLLAFVRVGDHIVRGVD